MSCGDFQRRCASIKVSPSAPGSCPAITILPHPFLTGRIGPRSPATGGFGHTWSLLSCTVFRTCHSPRRPRASPSISTSVHASHIVVSSSSFWLSAFLLEFSILVHIKIQPGFVFCFLFFFFFFFT